MNNMSNALGSMHFKSLDDPPKPTWMPGWRKVDFPGGKRFEYPTLEKANNARILARAFENWRLQELDSNGALPLRALGWSAFARHLGIARASGTRLDGQPRKGGLSANAGEPFYQLCRNGRLPKDPKVLDLIYKLARYPWE